MKKATYTKSGSNYLPCIVHEGGRRETIYGSPLATKATAKKYAQIWINHREYAARFPLAFGHTNA